MNYFFCSLGFHKWEGCICSRCGHNRDKGHDWSKNCVKCHKCGKSRLVEHNWRGCKCSKCSQTRDEAHDYNKDCTKCSLCGKTSQNNHNWSQDCTICSKCGKTRKKGHVYEGCTCIICGKTRFGEWPIYLWEHSKGTSPLCIYCNRLLDHNFHEQLHNWHVKNIGKLSLLSYMNAEGYVNSCIWQIGHIIEAKYDDPCLREEPPRQYYGTHLNRFVTDALCANVIESDFDRLSITSASKYETRFSSSGESMTLLVSCSADDPKGSQARWDLVLLDPLKEKGLTAFPSIPNDSKVILSVPVFGFRCAEIQEYKHPATELNGCGLYLVINSQHDRVYFGYSLVRSIAETAKDDLDKGLYLPSCSLFVLSLRFYCSPQLITPRTIAAIFKSAIRNIKFRTANVPYMGDQDLDWMEVELKGFD